MANYEPQRDYNPQKDYESNATKTNCGAGCSPCTYCRG